MVAPCLLNEKSPREEGDFTKFLVVHFPFCLDSLLNFPHTRNSTSKGHDTPARRCTSRTMDPIRPHFSPMHQERLAATESATSRLIAATITMISTRSSHSGVPSEWLVHCSRDRTLSSETRQHSSRPPCVQDLPSPQNQITLALVVSDSDGPSFLSRLCRYATKQPTYADRDCARERSSKRHA